jgi:hypothetical protein
VQIAAAVGDLDGRQDLVARGRRRLGSGAAVAGRGSLVPGAANGAVEGGDARGLGLDAGQDALAEGAHPGGGDERHQADEQDVLHQRRAAAIDDQLPHTGPPSTCRAVLDAVTLPIR